MKRDDQYSLWTKEEDSILYDLYPTRCPKEEILKKLPKRTWGAIQSRACCLSIKNEERRHRGKSNGKNVRWSNEEVKILKENYMLSNKEIKKLLPNRSIYAITGKKRNLGLKTYQHPPPLLRVPNLGLSDKDKIWIACAIDCDGYIGICKYTLTRNNGGRKWYYEPRIEFTNTNEEISNYFNRLIPGSFWTKQENKSTNRKAQYHIITKKKSLIYTLLKQIYQYLIVKKKQARLIIEFIEIQDSVLKKTPWRQKIKYTERQCNIHKEILKLNRRGL